MFIGRKWELKSLHEQYDKKGLSMTVLYGRRRIGKSTLISHFIEDKKAIFYTATKVGAQRNLELFARQAASVLDNSYINANFAATEDIFDFITNKTGEDKLVLIIDEFPYWAEKDEGLLSILQKYIDLDWAEKNIFIILCGSSLSFMENKILSEKSPLFGRRTSQIKLEAFNYAESALFVPAYTSEAKAVCYGITGGVAKYLALLDDSLSLDENIKRLFFNKDGYLYDEPRNLLAQEFTDVTLVNNIIEQIAAGESSLNVIADKVHESSSAILYSLGKLIEVGLVEKKYCITEERNRKKLQYVIKDHMFKFWYEFIPKAASVIEMGYGDLYYDKVVKPGLHSYMGSIFEEMCRYFTLSEGIRGRFGNFITNVGSWWGTEPVQGEKGSKAYQTADIDVVAISEFDNTCVIGECKFKNEKIGKDVYDTLLRRSNLISGYHVTKFLLFSLSGYTDWFDSLSDENCLCFTLDDLYKAEDAV